MYTRTIKNIKFELITPNMANISAALSEDLKSLAKERIRLKHFLKLMQMIQYYYKNDKQINSIVDYASEVEEIYLLKLKELKTYTNCKFLKSVEIGEIEITDSNMDKLLIY
jgi:hypothetical protein